MESESDLERVVAMILLKKLFILSLVHAFMPGEWPVVVCQARGAGRHSNHSGVATRAVCSDCPVVPGVSATCRGRGLGIGDAWDLMDRNADTSPQYVLLPPTLYQCVQKCPRDVTTRRFHVSLALCRFFKNIVCSKAMVQDLSRNNSVVVCMWSGAWCMDSGRGLMETRQ